MKTATESLKNVGNSKYFGTAVTSQNYINVLIFVLPSCLSYIVLYDQ
jgi:hypothetical protein